MKINNILFVILSLLASSMTSQVRNCATMEHLEFLKSQDPFLESRMEKNENNLQHWIRNNSPNSPESSGSSIITIPVVVHVVYYNSNENISTAQVQSQIDILNPGDNFKYIDFTHYIPWGIVLR